MGASKPGPAAASASAPRRSLALFATAMNDDPRTPGERPELSAVERRVQRSLDGEHRRGRRISTEELQRERTVENYLRGALMPRWMEPLRETHSGIERHRTRLAADHAWLREQCGEDAERFAREWRELVAQ